MLNIRKVHGPYQNNEGRMIVIIVYNDGHKKTTAYARYLMMVKLGRELTELETVDHKDNSFFNDSIDNLQLLSLPDNIKKSAKGRMMYEFTCQCGKLCIKPLNHIRNNWKQRCSGPYCSKRCAGKYSSPSVGTGIQN